MKVADAGVKENRVGGPVLLREPARRGPAAGAGGHKREALRGTAWIVAGFGSAHVLRFGFNLLLTRLLVPEVFGLMALVNTLVLGLQLFSDVGIGPSIIQHKSGDDPRFLNTAWTVQVVRGLLLWAAAALLAWPAAAFYHNPLLLWLVPAAGANAALAGFNSTSLHTLARRLVRGRLVLLNVGAYLAGMVVTVAWVLCVRADVWGFVIGSLVNSAATLAVSHLLLPGFRNRFCWDASALRELMHFGKWIFLSTLCTFLADQTDRLVLGRVTSLETLGLYQIAHQLTWMPAYLLYAIAAQVVFPVYSRQHQSGQGVAVGVRHLHPLVTGFGALMATGLFVTGPVLIGCLYGERYAAAGWMAQFLAAGALFKMLEAAASSVLLATGQSRAPAFSNAVKTLALVVLLPAGYHWHGLPGLLGALAAADLVRYVVTVSALRRRGLCVLRDDLALLLCAAGVCAAGLYAGRLPWLPANKWARLGVSAGVVLSLWAAVFLGARAWRRRGVTGTHG